MGRLLLLLKWPIVVAEEGQEKGEEGGGEGGVSEKGQSLHLRLHNRTFYQHFNQINKQALSMLKLNLNVIINFKLRAT